ncbi:SoxR reducing system RseC family protein [Vibrio algicola]|uniref:Transcriptional regulator n=1 Tax=Vibrio algicola TaxID=2662262 RepID=A0A5Q0TE14_9VIBR|nr:SoxR reducing system RseC family protein [Vibrio algicola]
MMTALATVIDVASRSGKLVVKVSCEQQTSCNHCKSQKSCGTGMVSKALGNKSHEWQLDSDQLAQAGKSLKAGQIVEIGLPEKSLVLSALTVYLLPLVAMMLGSLIAQVWLRPLLGGGEGIVIFMFFLFGGVGIYFAKPLTDWLETKVGREVSLIRVLGQPIC